MQFTKWGVRYSQDLLKRLPEDVKDNILRDEGKQFDEPRSSSSANQSLSGDECDAGLDDLFEETYVEARTYNKRNAKAFMTNDNPTHDKSPVNVPNDHRESFEMFLINIEELLLLALRDMGSGNLEEIYWWISSNYPQYKLDDKSWQCRVRTKECSKTCLY